MPIASTSDAKCGAASSIHPQCLVRHAVHRRSDACASKRSGGLMAGPRQVITQVSAEATEPYSDAGMCSNARPDRCVSLFAV